MTEGSGIHRHHYHSFRNRGLYCLAIASFVLGLGTFGFHFLEKFSTLDAFYFASMIATGQGPVPSVFPVTAPGKIFTCLYAFISVGSMVASLGFLFGPFLGKLFRIGVMKLEEELHLKKPDRKKPEG